MLFKLGCRS